MKVLKTNGPLVACFVTTACFVTMATKHAGITHFCCMHVLPWTKWWKIMQTLYRFFNTWISVHVILCVCLCKCQCVLCVARTGKGRGDGRAVCMSAWMWVCSDDPSDGHCGPKNTEYSVFSNTFLRDDVHLEDFRYQTITHEPGNSKRFSLCCCVSYVCDICHHCWCSSFFPSLFFLFFFSSFLL